jgi:hypothetical protein
MEGEAFDSPQNHLWYLKILFGHQTKKALFMFLRKKLELLMQLQPTRIYEYNLETKITKKHNRI